MSGWSIDALRELVRHLLRSHPRIEPFAGDHTTHLERYRTLSGQPIGHGFEPTTYQNIWVRAEAVPLHALEIIRHDPYDHRSFGESKPNHHLFGIPEFNGVDLICFRVKRPWEAVRVIGELAGEARP
jgi:hypothetical protein